jgi:hypothetical protein
MIRENVQALYRPQFKEGQRGSILVRPDYDGNSVFSSFDIDDGGKLYASFPGVSPNVVSLLKREREGTLFQLVKENEAEFSEVREGPLLSALVLSSVFGHLSEKDFKKLYVRRFGNHGQVNGAVSKKVMGLLKHMAAPGRSRFYREIVFPDTERLPAGHEVWYFSDDCWVEGRGIMSYLRKKDPRRRVNGLVEPVNLVEEVLDIGELSDPIGCGNRPEVDATGRVKPVHPEYNPFDE